MYFDSLAWQQTGHCLSCLTSCRWKACSGYGQWLKAPLPELGPTLFANIRRPNEIKLPNHVASGLILNKTDAKGVGPVTVL